MDKCKGCICIQCAKEFGVNPIECEISDCIWCRNERVNNFDGGLQKQA